MSEVERLLQTEAASLRAPERLRARVLERAAAVQEPRFVLPAPRRLLLVAAPAAVAAVAAVALVKGVADSGPGAQTGAAVAGGSTVRGRGGAVESAPSLRRQRRPLRADARKLGLPDLAAPGVPAPTGRLTDYQAMLLVRVRDLDRLTDATSDAVRIVRSLHGYAFSVNTTTGNGPGRSYLELRVPAARVQEALLRLSDLGTVLSQQLSQQDLENVVTQQNARIAAVRRAIKRIRIALADPSLPADVRVRLEFQLDEARHALAGGRKAKAATLREAATAKISLELTTERSASAPPTKGRFDRSIDGAADFLVAAGAVGLALLIGASPFLVLIALAVAGRRAWRRREERRLLAAQ